VRILAAELFLPRLRDKCDHDGVFPIISMHYL
jgi:hypothetical protein